MPLDLGGTSSGDTLQLLVGGGNGEPERLLVLDKPDARGVVRVRSWSSDDWSAPPVQDEREATALLREIEGWARQRRGLNHQVTVVRRWLERG